MPEENICTRCHDNPRAPYQRWCQECIREYNRQYRLEHGDELKAKYKAQIAAMSPEELQMFREIQIRHTMRYLSKPGNYEKHKKYARQYYQTHKEYYAERFRKWKQEHEEYYKAYQKKYREKHKGKKG